MKKRIAVENLLQWALREELPKGRPVSTSPWDLIEQYGRLGRPRERQYHGGLDQFGMVAGTPHPDAEIVGDAVGLLDENASLSVDLCREILGPYAALDDDAVNEGATRKHNMRGLIVRCAVLGQRMPWRRAGLPVPRLVRPADGNQWALAYAERDGELVEVKPFRDYTYPMDGRPRCLLRWGMPSVAIVLHERAEYTVWHHALTEVATMLVGKLADYAPLPPRSAARPWETGQPKEGRVLSIASGPMAKLPLAPSRPAARAGSHARG